VSGEGADNFFFAENLRDEKHIVCECVCMNI